MDERAALTLLADELDPVGDDAAIVDGLVVTTDMLHERTDFPAGTTRYTAGWRSVGASLSDVAAMGAEAIAAVAAYAAPEFDREELLGFVRGASDVCESVGAEYVGGDLDGHDEFTVSTTAIGRTTDPVRRGGARPGDVVCVTGTLGRTAAAIAQFERGDHERGNDLFQFEPRVAAGRALAPHATAMMDSSDGLARSLHQLAEASDCGFAIESDSIPIDDAVFETTDSEREALDRATTFGEDFELVCTIPEDDVAAARADTPVALTPIGSVLADGVSLDGDSLADRGYTHG
ncbi:thiamine-phosphate kinase [Halosolutus amylolyticus]|uniref:Thiamine-monophosphate kinase n=1 Tax=Halosolutus amylolyticus TaxID=2932267 RepID=A0ABD5PQK2_9EURY|nr:thiamine-phosphate kinase [Halosolutus amylolyticus]